MRQGVLFFLLLLPNFIFAQFSTGPEQGSLLIIGGGQLDSVFYHLFMEKAGGAEAPIVVIPTAFNHARDSQARDFANLKSKFEGYGFKNVTVIHTTSPEEANTEAFIAPLKKAKGIWFTGGRQWRLMDAYFGTKAYDAFWNVLNDGGIVAGSSAGATIQGSFLARGDSGANTIMMGDHQQGFSFITNVAIDQHLLKRNRQFDMLEIMEAHPHLLGIGLDENTGILVTNETFEVVGESYVLMYNDQHFDDPKKKFHFLKKGDKYNLVTRNKL